MSTALPHHQQEMRKAKAAAKEFSKKWLQRAGDEKQESQQFWSELLRTVFGVETPEDLVLFEERVEVGHTRYIDVHIPSTRVIIEQKSADVDLSVAQGQSGGAVLTPYEQAKRYSDNLAYDERARWIVTCNFREFRVHDMSLRKESDRAVPVSIISLQELPEHYHRLSFLVDTQSVRVAKEKEVSMQAGELISKIYNALLARCESPNDPVTLQHLNKFCVRLVFCLYAEDAGLFNKDQFEIYMAASANPREARQRLLALFAALNTKIEERDPYDKELLAFPYVNGGLFADERLIIPMLDEELLHLILHDASASFDWQYISPTIFGGLFESTLNPDTRRSGGMHYTSIENIHKVIDPLFLDDLKAEFAVIQRSDKAARTRRDHLLKLQDKLARLTILDPACGSGNFLTESFISLRRLENDILREVCRLERDSLQQDQLLLTKVSIQQFFGIEINDFAVSVAKAALWIADAQMWEEAQSVLHNRSAFLPLKQYVGIREGNALQLDWLENVPNRHVDYIIGNPPFAGTTTTSEEQKADIKQIFNNARVGYLDYVACWHMKAARIMAEDTATRTAFVSTNSITQGEQVFTLWSHLSPLGVSIEFAHRTFKWKNEADNMAAVHCIVMGLAVNSPIKHKKLFYNRDGESCCDLTEKINGYLIAGSDVIVTGLTKALNAPKNLLFGNKPSDGGHLIFTPEEREAAIAKDPALEKYIHPYFGSVEFLHIVPAEQAAIRYCLWLKDVPLAERLKHPIIMERTAKVREMREASKAASTRQYAAQSHLFRQIAQNGDEPCLLMPRVSSERRAYVPLGFMPAGTIMSDLVYIVPHADLYDFAIVSSRMHMAWMKVVCGRLEMRYRYSRDMCYNTFVWPENISEQQKAAICSCAQEVLDIRAANSGCCLAVLYNPETMPYELQKAHAKLDAAVEKAYGRKFKDDADRVAHLFELYKGLTEK